MKRFTSRAVGFLATVLVACGARPDPHRSLERLIHAARTPVTDTARRTEANNALRDAVESGALEGKFRDEVDEILGRGNVCSAHPDCLQRGFEPDDRVYGIGTDPAAGVARLPLLFVHSDGSGRISGMRYLTVN